MLGIVLCGGQSSRMGRDKGLIGLKTKTWAQTAANKIESLGIPFKVSVNNGQFDLYCSVFSTTDLIIDDETLPLKGPLLGVLSCHLQFPLQDLLILACDMQLMDPSILNELYLQYKHGDPADAYIFYTDGKAEPLCGIYTAKALAGIFRRIRQGHWPNYSMKSLLEHLNTMGIPIKAEQRKYFQNFNHPEHLDRQL